jgi:RNA polymerase sigma factor (sigma-70 family)
LLLLEARNAPDFAVASEFPAVWNDPIDARRRRIYVTDGSGLDRPVSAVRSDAELLTRVATGDEAALEGLYQRYGAACFALARRLLDDAGLAEDVTQQVFLALWQGHSYDPARGAVSTWLLSVTHHKAVDAIRREGRQRKVASHDPLIELADAPGPDDEAWRRLRAERTRAALRTLSAEMREVLLLAYYGGYSQREIADLTGLPLGTVKSRTLAAMNKLRGELSAVDDRDDDESGRTS